MADAARARKVADRIHETVARLLQGRIKDPRLGFVTVTDVRVTGDLQQATVFYTVYGSDEEREETAKALRSAKGLIRSEVGKALGIRLTPSLSFQLDALPTTAKTLEDALAQARVRDAQIAKVAEGATYAGDADPYRHEEDEDHAGDRPIAAQPGQERGAEAINPGVCVAECVVHGTHPSTAWGTALLWSAWALLARSIRVLRFAASAWMPTPATRSRPTAARCQALGTPMRISELLMSWTSSTPRIVPRTDPRPPKIDAPPRTTAAMMSRSWPTSSWGLADLPRIM